MIRSGARDRSQATSCSMPAGCVVEALGKTAGSRMGVEKIPADIDADQNSVHERTSLNHKNEPEEPTAFLFQLVNAGFAPSDYSNRGAPISERTQLTVGPENPRGGRSRSKMVLVLHNPGFNGYRVDDGNIPAVGDPLTSCAALKLSPRE